MADIVKLIIKIDGDKGIDALGKIGLAGLTTAVGAIATGFGYAVKVGSDFEAQLTDTQLALTEIYENMGAI